LFWVQQSESLSKQSAPFLNSGVLGHFQADLQGSLFNVRGDLVNDQLNSLVIQHCPLLDVFYLNSNISQPA
jgi:hypothetical protein